MNKIWMFLAVLFMMAETLFAGNGDMIVHGNLGVGTATPTEQVEISKNFRMPPSTATEGIIYSGPDWFIHNFGTRNFFAGALSGNLSLTGSHNVGIGMFSLNSNTTGSYNTGSGVQALANNDSGDSNTAHGAYSLNDNTEGNQNTATGYGSLYTNTSGDYNTSNGAFSLQDNTEGRWNTAIGYAALNSNTTWNSNTAVGSHSLYFETAGAFNTAIGTSALYTNSTGSHNTALGYRAGYNTTGAGNLFLGYKAGYNETGSDKLYIANNDVNPPLIYGDFSTGRVGLGTTTPGYTLHVEGTAYCTSGAWASDARFKTNVKSIGKALDQVSKLNGLSYEWKIDEYKEKGFPEGTHYGLLAQEVEKVLPEIVREGPSGDKAIAYTEIIPLLIEAVKEERMIVDEQQRVLQKMQVRIHEQQEEIKALQEQQAVFSVMYEKVNKLEKQMQTKGIMVLAD